MLFDSNYKYGVSTIVISFNYKAAACNLYVLYFLMSCMYFSSYSNLNYITRKAIRRLFTIHAFTFNYDVNLKLVAFLKAVYANDKAKKEQKSLSEHCSPSPRENLNHFPYKLHWQHLRKMIFFYTGFLQLFLFVIRSSSCVTRM